MPSVLTYPGVYIEEVPSGVRTISGVGTSIAAFVGYTAKGTLNAATRVQSFADFERAFGGLSRDSELSYAVQQYFLNGGSDAYVVRIAKGAAAAALDLNYEASNGSNGRSMTVTAMSPGAWGNQLRVNVDYDTASPDTTFNLVVTQVDPVTQAAVATEQFNNLSMDPSSPSYARSVVNAGSNLVRLSNLPTAGETAYSISKDVSAGVTIDATHNRIAGTIDGVRTFELVIPDATYANAGTLATAIQGAIDGAGITGLTAVRVRDDGTTTGTAAQQKYVALRSGAANASGSVVVRPAASNDASALLGMGVSNGGREFSSTSFRRPVQTGTTTGDLSTAMGTAVTEDLTFTVANNLPSGSVALMAAQVVSLTAATVDAALANTIQSTLNAALDPVAKKLRVSWVGRSLRVSLPDYPNAVITVAESAAAAPLRFPATGDATSNAQRYALGITYAAPRASTGPVTAGADGTAPDAADFLGSEAAKTGLWALLDTDLFTLLSLPGAMDLAGGDLVAAEAVALCERRRAFFIVDPPSDSTLDTIGAWATNVTTSDHAAVYWPRIVVADPLDGFRPRTMSPSGAVAGVYARTDSERGIWKAPAGTDATLRGTQALSYNLTDLECGRLNPAAVNCLRSFPVYGRVVWGGRTRKGANAEANAEYRYVPVRRLASYIEESLYRGTQWVVFEPNDEPLWAQIRLGVGAFMNGLFRQGAFQGKSPAQAYLVKCDSDTTTQNDIDLGVVNILVAFAPLKPAEFVVIRLQQKAGQVAA